MGIGGDNRRAHCRRGAIPPVIEGLLPTQSRINIFGARVVRKTSFIPDLRSLLGVYCQPFAIRRRQRVPALDRCVASRFQLRERCTSNRPNKLARQQGKTNEVSVNECDEAAAGAHCE